MNEPTELRPDCIQRKPGGELVCLHCGTNITLRAFNYLSEPKGARGCPYCGHDAVLRYLDREHKELTIGLILALEWMIGGLLTWFMSFMAVIFIIVLVSEDKFFRMLGEVALFIAFSGSGELGDTVGCCMVLTYVGALVTGWLFQYQYEVNKLGDDNRMPISLTRMRLLSIVGALNIICAVATGILIFYISKYL